ncbi:MAG: lipid A biosynthesis lauroyl acyltransferase [Nitratireductor sp.]|nr:lipid A biosynthesis lauroyl acyltransferase [Nitratireductor sp.]
MAKKRTQYPKWYVWLRNARDWSIAALALGSIRLIKFLPADPAIHATARLARIFGMWFPRTEDARDNLRQAFPEKSPDEIEEILRDMWENLGRTGAEYAFLDKIFDVDLDHPERGRFEISGIPNFEELRDHDGPAICFTAHTGNWEVLPIAAAAFDLNITALFRPPNNPYLARKLLKARKTAMGHLVPSRAGAAWALSGVMDEGGKVGLLADQHYNRGPMVTFFGREAPANPLLGKLARNFDCPVYPARTIRLPNGRYRIELQDRLELPRDARGRVDADALTQQITAIMEGWIREHPGQWLWLHRRWRGQTQRLPRWQRKKLHAGRSQS